MAWCGVGTFSCKISDYFSSASDNSLPALFNNVGDKAEVSTGIVVPRVAGSCNVGQIELSLRVPLAGLALQGPAI